jgi:hypothetical protein
MFPFEFLRPPPLQNLSTMQTQNQGRKKEHPVKTKAASIEEHIREIA